MKVPDTFPNTFRKKPITVEAMRFTEENKNQVYSWAKSLQMNVEACEDPEGVPALYIPTLEGSMYCNMGDYLIKEPFPTDWRKLYPCKKEIFEATYFQGETPTPGLDDLNHLQEQVGYAKGPVNIIALLGLFGEAGEVLNEVFLIDNTDEQIKAEDLKLLGVSSAEKIDDLKKAVRDLNKPISVFLRPSQEQPFDIELADTLYYLNALARNRGLTLDELAAISVAKVKAKGQQNISHGSSVTN